MKQIKLAVCAGGTGGHIYPAMAAAIRLSKDYPQSEIFFFSSGKHVENEIYFNAGFKSFAISSAALKRTISFTALKSLLLIVVAFFQAISILKKQKPHCLLSTGGYICLPCVTQ